MNDELRAVIDGIATGLGFVGVLGFAVNAAAWPLLLLLVGIAIALVVGTRLGENYER
jgi:energy-converting hydrogenase Eha subunit G